MKNEEALDFFNNMAATTNDSKSVKLAHVSDFTQLDADFILARVTDDSDILDLGSGTGLIINKIYDKVHHITAVEPFSQFTRFIVSSKNVQIINETFENLKLDRQYDAITIFGTMHYFNEEEAIGIYKKCFPALRNGGCLIVKNQFGVTKDVTVSGYSEEQKSNYFAQYRFVEKEVDILQKIGFRLQEVADIYPPEANRWDNTHFYAIVVKK
ncbi:MAG: class I SAM-dependent methyltransferase [Bacteroidales bacterium]|nr:class I SAM-dependent methyltransferase [Bacteroidales bacterium]